MLPCRKEEWQHFSSACIPNVKNQQQCVGVFKNYICMFYHILNPHPKQDYIIPERSQALGTDCYKLCQIVINYARLLWIMPDCYELCQIVMNYARLLWIMPDCYKFCQIVTFRDKLSTTRFLSYWFKKLWGWTVNDQWKGSIPNEIVDIKVSLFRTLSMMFF